MSAEQCCIHRVIQNVASTTKFLGVDGGACQEPRDAGGQNDGKHHRHNQRILPRHFDDDQNGGHRSACRSSECRAHTNHTEDSGGSVSNGGKDLPECGSGHCADKKRRGKNATGSTDTDRVGRVQGASHHQNQQEANRVFAC